MPKTVSQKLLSDLISNAEKRKEWDTQLVDIKTIEQYGNSTLIQSKMKSPFSTPENDCLEKSVKFEHNNATYLFSSSANDNVLPVNKGTQRCYSIFSSYKIEEDENNFIIYGLFQADPQSKTEKQLQISLMEEVFPGQLSKWYNGYLGAVRSE